MLLLDLSLSISKHISWSYRYYGWVCRCSHQSVKIKRGRIMVGFFVFVVRQ